MNAWDDLKRQRERGRETGRPKLSCGLSERFFCSSNGPSLCEVAHVMRQYLRSAIYSRKWSDVCVCVGARASALVFSRVHIYCAVEHVCEFYLSSIPRHSPALNGNLCCALYAPKKKLFLLALVYIYCCCYIAIAACVVYQPLHCFFFRGKSFTIFSSVQSSCPVVAEKKLAFIETTMEWKEKKRRKLNGMPLHV